MLSYIFAMMTAHYLGNEKKKTFHIISGRSKNLLQR